MFPCLGFLLLSSQLVSVSHSTIKSPRPVTFHVLNTAPCAWKVLEGEGLFLKGSCSLSAPGPRQKPELQMHHGRPSLPEDILGDPASPRTSWCGQEDKCCTPNPGLLELCLGQMRGINACGTLFSLPMVTSIPRKPQPGPAPDLHRTIRPHAEWRTNRSSRDVMDIAPAPLFGESPGTSLLPPGHSPTPPPFASYPTFPLSP
ncbi:uncharacterized protein LOC114808898 isoform X2 [Ornithorhynchus anatinus]|uniref:uncharacterized protein LOC114808898 isoform X2 n=1 Tax=Ornithorhynchus anatinus TaxID=9258 RepID=UPI0010A7D1FF|nr:uncharacterized protein LOC114808898 isoform X2 [Ornithorhynchus anatinus]